MKIGSINYQLFIYKSKTNRKGLAPIYCKLFYEDQFKVVSTGIKVKPQNWDVNKYQIIKHDNLNNNLLEIWKQKLHKILIDIYSQDHAIYLVNIALLVSGKKTTPSIKKISMGFVEVYNLYIAQANKTVGEHVQKRTVQKYKTVCNSFKDFIKSYYNTKDISLNELKLKHLLEYEEYCLAVSKHKQVTVNKSVQLLKQIIKYAVGRDYIDKDPWLLHKSKTAPTIIVYLSKEQLHILEHSTVTSEKLQKVKDCFIFSCYTGLAYAELAALTPNNVSPRNDILWISMKRLKTAKTQKLFFVPLLPPAEKIWNKYNGALPVPSNQKYNEYLKELAKEINLKAHLTTHLARKTFTTTVLLGNNIPLKVASTLLGHSNTKITEKHYAAITNDLLDQHVGNLFDIFKDKKRG